MLYLDEHLACYHPDDAAVYRAALSTAFGATTWSGPTVEQCVVLALATSGLNPDRLILEVTKDVLIQDADTMFASLTRLHGLGVRIALDRSGTGHSGWNQLRRFPFAAIKLHQSLVCDLGQTEAAAMARAIVGLCAAPGVEVVAEGVETREELNLARGIGCTEVQGFLFSEPPQAEQAAKLIGGIPAEGWHGVRGGVTSRRIAS